MGLFDSNTILQTQTAGYGNLNARQNMMSAGIDQQGDSQAYRDWASAQGLGSQRDFAQASQELNQGAQQRGQQMIDQGQRTDAAGAQAAAQGMGYQQRAYGDVGNWLAAGPGPSVAQAQLAQQNDQNTAQLMAMANSGRGSAGSAAARNSAMYQSAAMGQQMSQQAATLRAQEAQSWRQQQLQAQGIRSDIGGNIASQGNQTRQLGLAQGQLGQNVIGQGQGLAANMYQAGAQNQLNWNQLGQQNYMQGMQLRGQMTEAAQNQATQIALANQKDYESTQAAQLGFVGGIASMAGAAAGGGGG